ncbi:MAG: exodeoxyribonuclease VII large subunit, partial [Phycisphaerales bacterium]
ATPTQAAMRIFPDAADLRRQLDSMHERIGSLLSRRIRLERERLRGLARHPFLADPAMLVSDRRDVLEDNARRLAAAARAGLLHARARLDRAAARLERHRPSAMYAHREARLSIAAGRLRGLAGLMLERRTAAVDGAERALDLVGPHSVLRRGYSVTLRDDGRVVRSVGDVTAGELVRTRLADGDFASVVQGDGSRFGVLPQPARRRVKRPRAGHDGPRDQMDLFGSAQ